MNNLNKTTPNLAAIPDGDGWAGSLNAAKLVSKDVAPAIEFDQVGVNGAKAQLAKIYAFNPQCFSLSERRPRVATHEASSIARDLNVCRAG